MSFFLTCPNCGPRDVAEFRYGGEILPDATTVGVVRPASNLPGPQRERWYHRFGCRRWLEVVRNVQTNEVLSTGWLGGDATVASGDET